MSPDLRINNARKKKRLSFITCPFCAEEILIIPDVKIMNKAIESHVEKHLNEKSIEELDRLQDNLIRQLFDKISLK